MWTWVEFVHFGLPIVNLVGWSVCSDYIHHPWGAICPTCGLISSVPFGLYVIIHVGWSFHLWSCFMSVHFGLHSLPLEGDPSTLRTCPCGTSCGHPRRMIRPPCGFYFISVHFVDFKWPSLQGDPSILWILFCIRPSCGRQVGILVGWSSISWTFKWSSFWVICPPCGQL